MTIPILVGVALGLIALGIILRVIAAEVGFNEDEYCPPGDTLETSEKIEKASAIVVAIAMGLLLVLVIIGT